MIVNLPSALSSYALLSAVLERAVMNSEGSETLLIKHSCWMQAYLSKDQYHNGLKLHPKSERQSPGSACAPRNVAHAQGHLSHAQASSYQVYLGPEYDLNCSPHHL